VTPRLLRNLVRRARTDLGEFGFRPYWVTVETCGEPIKVYFATRETENWLKDYRTVENREMTFMRDRLLPRGCRAVEVGTHQGFSASLIGKWIGPEGTLITFDPVATNCELARGNLAANDLPNVTVRHQAVGDQAGKTFISNANSNASVQASGVFGTEVDLVTLDREITGPIDFLKIDVEGYELHVLRGAQRLLASAPNLAIEIHPGPIEEFGGKVDDVFSLIKADAYDYFLQFGTVDEPMPYTPPAPIVQNAHLFCVRRGG
jgi:FkbM family methyltransferase